MIRALLLAALLTGCATAPIGAPHPNSGVKVMVGNGHGSGVYIGKGIVLTSAHVVQDKAEVTLKSASGGWQQGTVLWKSDKYDVAAIQPFNPKVYDIAPLSCRVPLAGEYAVAYGSPLINEFLYLPGTVAGKPTRMGDIETVSPAAIPLTSGSSGGPVFNAQGHLIGIVAAVQVTTLFEKYPSQTGISYFVPGNVICGLLGRG